MLWPHPWHSLFKGSHIVHKGASWNGKQCCLRKFSFSLHGKFIFHFPSAQKEVFFVKELPNNYCKIGTNQFYKILGHIYCTITKWLGVKFFDPPLVKKTNCRRFSWKRVKFELKLPHCLLFIFSKNHF